MNKFREEILKNMTNEDIEKYWNTEIKNQVSHIFNIKTPIKLLKKSNLFQIKINEKEITLTRNEVIKYINKNIEDIKSLKK